MDTQALRQIRSFVRREGRITPAQQRSLDTRLPRYEIAAGAGTLDLPQLFGREAPLGLEIGFGGGEHLAHLAQQRPTWDFIGLEVHRPGVGRLLLRLEAQDTRNVRVAIEDAQIFINERLPPASLDAIYIQFPDPWPKKRHHKRRLVQPDFIQTLVSRLKPGALLQLATDWADYAEHMLQVLDQAPGLINVTGPGQYAQRPDNRIPTRFEQRGERLGHAVFDLVYRSV